MKIPTIILTQYDIYDGMAPFDGYIVLDYLDCRQIRLVYSHSEAGR